jgi:hypothetical protein
LHACMLRLLPMLNALSSARLLPHSGFACRALIACHILSVLDDCTGRR